MTNIGSNTWCYTITTPGTYDWKPVLCGSWYSWNSTDYARNVNATDWSVTTTVPNSQVCVTYAPLTGLLSMGVILPLRLSIFKGYAENNRNILAWHTETEENSSHFEIEKSIDGTTWATLGTVKASIVSKTTQQYSFVDTEPIHKMAYYRLKMIDNDRSFTYSKIITINQTPTNAVKVFPNPAKEQLTFIFSNEVKEPTVELFNINGQLVKQPAIPALTN